MRWPVYLYYGLLYSCFIASLSYLGNFKIRSLAILLLISIEIESVSEIVGVARMNHFFLYHFYNIIEYLFVILIIGESLPAKRKRMRSLMIVSAVVYAILSLWISLAVEGLNKYPSLGTSIESVAAITWCLICLLSLEPSDDIPIQRRSDFWIILAFFLYFSGTFCFDGIYNTLLANSKTTAQWLFSVINSVFNYILYILLIIGIKCFRAEEKYSRS